MTDNEKNLKRAFFLLLRDYKNFCRGQGYTEIDFCYRCPVSKCPPSAPSSDCKRAILNAFMGNHSKGEKMS